MSNVFDAIVVGSGISGGWAAKELCEKGLKVLLLERGRQVDHPSYPDAMKAPWEFPHRERITDQDRREYYIQSQTRQFSEATKPFFVKDTDQPYATPDELPFYWIRGYQVGGRSLTWGRQSYRLSDLDFEANLKDGIAVDWPIRYKDLEPWYDYVESFAGISGQAEGLPHLPDGKFLPPMEMNCAERHVKDAIARHFPGRVMTIGRVANLTQPHNGRGSCQYRNLCSRGCPYGAYFSSNSATLPAAAATGNLTLRSNAIVHSVIYDEQQDRAAGVQVIDAETLAVTEYFARIIFLNASTINTAAILLNSATPRFSEGLGNSSGQLGKNLMDHHFMAGARGEIPGFEDQHYYGRRPNGVYVPRFRNLGGERSDYIRGFGYQGLAMRSGWGRGMQQTGFGADFKDQLAEPGPWIMNFTGFGECLPHPGNFVNIDPSRQDTWGMPIIQIVMQFRENERAMRPDMVQSAAEMLEAAGAKQIQPYDEGAIPGLGIHEMGTARMGRDPKTSVLNAWNQMHDVPNIFITDGSAMTSSACQNPSLTYMALTARACDYAVRELKRGNL